MYSVFSESSSADSSDIYGIEHDGEKLFLLGDSKSCTALAVALLNDNSVEPCHAYDVIEDIFFTA